MHDPVEPLAFPHARLFTSKSLPVRIDGRFHFFRDFPAFGLGFSSFFSAIPGLPSNESGQARLMPRRGHPCRNPLLKRA